MSLPVIARTTVLDPWRSRSGVVKLAVFVVFYGLVGWVVGGSTGPLGRTVAQTSSGLIPLFAFPLAYDAVAGPRESGTARLLLSYPHTRRDVVLGTAAGRAAEFASYVAAGLLIAVVAALAAGGGVEPSSFAVVATATVAFAVVFALFVVGCSALVATTNRAVGLLLGVLFTVGILWGQIPGLVAFALAELGVDPNVDAWAPTFAALSPINAYSTLVRTLDPTLSMPTAGFETTAWFAALVLLGWAVVPLAAGYARFDAADL